MKTVSILIAIIFWLFIIICLPMPTKPRTAFVLDVDTTPYALTNTSSVAIDIDISSRDFYNGTK